MNAGSKLAVSLAVMLGLLGAWDGAARATLLRNPISDVKSGQVDAGFGVSTHTLTFFGDFGLGVATTLEVSLGSITFGGASANEIGVGFHYEIGAKSNVGSKQVRLGPFVLLNVGLGSADFEQLMVGFGGSVAVAKDVQIFGAPFWHRLSSGGLSDSRLGMLLGAEFRPADNWLVGAELHLGLDTDDYGIYTAVKF
jgi:hypothetical protein